jgi:hypothetical protein
LETYDKRKDNIKVEVGKSQDLVWRSQCVDLAR